MAGFAPIYTVTLAEFHALSSEVVTVPDDFQWVLSTASVFYPGGASAPGVQLVDSVTGGTIFWDSAAASVVGLWRYWVDLRLVMPPGRSYALSGLESPDVLLCGYQLTPS